MSGPNLFGAYFKTGDTLIVDGLTLSNIPRHRRTGVKRTGFILVFGLSTRSSAHFGYSIVTSIDGSCVYVPKLYDI